MIHAHHHFFMYAHAARYHLHFQNIVLQFDLDSSFGSRHDAIIKFLFLQLR